MSPQISVIIPLYDKGPYISRAITSVLSQTVQDFEIIIVDDQSSDEGPLIVRSFADPRISFIGQDHRGVSYTRNHGAHLAKSDFLAFLDADDEWMPNHLEILFRLIRRFPDAGMYSDSYQKFLKSGKLEHARYREIPKAPFEGILPDYFKAAARGDDPIAVSVAALSKKVFFLSGGFPVGESKGEDLDLWAKIALQYPVAFSSETGAIVHEEASNRACDIFHSIEEEPLVKNGKKAIAEGIVPERLLPYFKEYIARKEIDTAIININAGDYILARKVLARIDTRYFLWEKIKLRSMTQIPKPLLTRIRQVKNYITNTGNYLAGKVR
jgi:glycosyltransferase involved in cell wall biosynthesis